MYIVNVQNLFMDDFRMRRLFDTVLVASKFFIMPAPDNCCTIKKISKIIL